MSRENSDHCFAQLGKLRKRVLTAICPHFPTHSSLVHASLRESEEGVSRDIEWPLHAAHLSSSSLDLVLPGRGMQIANLLILPLLVPCRARDRGKTRVVFCVHCKRKIGQFAYTPSTYASRLYSFQFTHRDSSHINVKHNSSSSLQLYTTPKVKHRQWEFD